MTSRGLGDVYKRQVHDVTTFAGPYDNPDPNNPKFYRSTATYQVAVRMSVA